MSTININIKYLIKKIEVHNDADLQDIQKEVTECIAHAVAQGAALGAGDKSNETELGERIKKAIFQSVEVSRDL